MQRYATVSPSVAMPSSFTALTPCLFAHTGVSQSKRVPKGYKPRKWDFGIFSVPEDGPEFLGVPDEACDLKEEEAAAILARWKGSYKLMPRNIGPERLGEAPFVTFTNVSISDDGMCFSGGSHTVRKWIKIKRGSRRGRRKSTTTGRANEPTEWKPMLRRGGEGELYVDNLGSQIVEEDPKETPPEELKIKLYQGGEIVLTRTTGDER